jgi:hypothetical protein
MLENEIMPAGIGGRKPLPPRGCAGREVLRGY